MSILGNSVTPNVGWSWPGSGYEFASSFTTPAGGGILISTLHAYFATPSGASTGYVCVWSNGGTLLGSVNIGSLPGGSQSPGGQSWQAGTLGVNLYVAGNTALWIGGYGTGNVVFSSGTGGASNVKSVGGGGPGSFGGSSSSGIGVAGAYVDYVLLSAPTISSATPNIGITGTAVAVVGTSFNQATSCTIGGAAASFVINSNTSITATVPSGAAPGLGTLVVTNPAGTGSIPFTSGGIVHMRRSGAWVTSTVSVRRSGAWVPVVVYVRRGGAWVVAS
jgi:hypothetical protein